MIAINHAATGAIIGLSMANPFVAGVAAFLSHFVCDGLPHFGSSDQSFITSTRFKAMLIVDTLLCVLLVLLLAISQIDAWLLAAMCAFLATSPDLWHIKSFIYARAGKAYHPGRIARFSSDIQWFQRPIGAFVELAWFVGATTLLYALI